MLTTVTNAAELTAALSAAVGGELISLAPGNYGVVSIVKVAATPITIASQDILSRAVFDALSIANSSNLRISDVHVSSPSNGTASSKIVSIVDSSDITLLDSEVNGLVDGDHSGHYALYTANTSRVTIAGNNIHDAWYGGVFNSSDNLTLLGNLIDRTGSDGLKFSGVFDFLIEDNTHGGNFFPGSTGAHVDFMQFQSVASARGVIRGNVCLAANHAFFQGIFMRGAAFDDMLIEQNIIHTAMANGIKIEVGTGNVIRDNTIVHLPDPGNKASYIVAPSGSIVSNNILAKQAPGGVINGNLEMQHTDPAGTYHYSKFFANAEAGLGLTIEDLRPVVGSLAETMGAAFRLGELLGAAPPPPDPIPDPIPDPTPAPENGMIYSSGPHSFSGLNSDAVIVPHDPTFEVPSGSIELRFTPAVLLVRQGLLSKDATGYGSGGHLGIFLESGNVVVRLQSMAETFNADAPSVTTVDVETHLVVTFGAGGMKTWINGVLAATNPYTGGLLGNTEPLVIGANAWASGDGVATPLADPFTGNTATVAIHDTELTETEIGILAGIIVPQTDAERIAELEAQVVALTSELATVSGALVTAQGDILALNGKIAMAQAALA